MVFLLELRYASSFYMASSLLKHRDIQQLIRKVEVISAPVSSFVAVSTVTLHFGQPVSLAVKYPRHTCTFVIIG